MYIINFIIIVIVMRKVVRGVGVKTEDYQSEKTEKVKVLLITILRMIPTTSRSFLETLSSALCMFWAQAYIICPLTFHEQRGGYCVSPVNRQEN